MSSLEVYKSAARLSDASFISTGMSMCLRLFCPLSTTEVLAANQIKKMSLSALNSLLADAHLDDLAEMLDQALRIDDDVNQAFALMHRLRESKPMKRCLAQLGANPDAVALIESRALMPQLTLNELMAHPKGSLGYTYGVLMKTLGCNPDFYVGPEYFNNLDSDADYVNYRTLATHDLHHVLTGFNFDTSGELGVISVSVAQFGAPGFAFISLQTLLTTWISADKPYSQINEDSERINSPRYKFSLIQQGITIGESARPLFALDWPMLMETNLDCLRQQLGVEPVREGLASWYSRPSLMAALA